MQNFKPLATFCGCTARFVSDLVGNPEDRFSHSKVHIKQTYPACTLWSGLWISSDPAVSTNCMTDWTPTLLDYLLNSIKQTYPACTLWSVLLISSDPAVSTYCMTDRTPTLLDCLSRCSITILNTVYLPSLYTVVRAVDLLGPGCVQ